MRRHCTGAPHCHSSSNIIFTMASIGRASGSAASRGMARYTASATASSPTTTRLTTSKATYTTDSQDDECKRNNAPHDGVAAGVSIDYDQNDDINIADIIWKPNQTTTIFQRMESECPDVMTAYAQCVIEKQNTGALTQDACATQFHAVMDCFRSVRTSLN